MKKPIIFCDFDGTITESDNIIALMKQFAPPEWEEIKDQILNQTITIQEGVGKLFSYIPSSKKQDMLEFLRENAHYREGFASLLTYANENDIPFYVVSGGVDFFVYPMLTEFDVPLEQIYCNKADFSSEKILIKWPHSCDTHCNNGCGCCKPSIIRSFDETLHECIVIGDSITDLEAAKLADLVFARDYLKEKCEELNITYQPFENFHQITNYLEGRKSVCR